MFRAALRVPKGVSSLRLKQLPLLVPSLSMNAPRTQLPVLKMRSYPYSLPRVNLRAIQFESKQEAKYSFHSSALPLKEEQSLYEAREPKANLDMIGGYKDVKCALIEVIRYLQNPKEFTKEGIKAPKGVLFSGPPGTGKTFFAEAVAGHSGKPIIVVSASSLIDTIVGGAEAKLIKLFNMAKETAEMDGGCVLCIDEIDSIGSKRFSSPSQGSELHANTLVNQLLVLLAENIPGLIVIGTTNNFEALDPAVTRPGRFDRHIVIPLPDKEDRLNILKIHTQNKIFDPSIDLEELARLSLGFSAAKIESWINEAANRTISKIITIKDLDEARSIIQYGSLGRKNPNPIKKRLAAIHETGHAVVGYSLGMDLYKVSVITTGSAAGYTEFLPMDNTPFTKEAVLNNICTLLGGRAAEYVFGFSQLGSESDLQTAKISAIRLVRDGLGSTLTGLHEEIDVEKILQEQLLRATQLLREQKSDCERIITALTTEDELFQKDFLNVLAGTHRSKSVFSFWPTSTSSSVIERKLPAKKDFSKRSTLFTTPFSFKENAKEKPIFPFTIEEVAKALKVDSDKIRSIKPGIGGGCAIKFKPSFNYKNHMDTIEKILRDNNIENFYSLNELEIKPDGYQDFLTFVKESNKPDCSPSL